MSIQIETSKYRYAPILSLSPSEMTAIEELPEKDKDLILPIIPIKGWSASKELKNSIKRVRKAIGQRFWVADIDHDFLLGNSTYQMTGEFPRPVFYEIQNLLNPKNGYENWISYLTEIPEAIPTLQLKDLTELELQLERALSLNRGIAVRFYLEDIESGISERVINHLAAKKTINALIIYDLGSIERRHIGLADAMANIIKSAHTKIPGALVAISATSFPSSFGGQSHGENSICERILFIKISKELNSPQLIYSDYGSARAEKQNGGGGIPAPRIDYPLKNDWRFIRKEFSDPNSPQEGEKERLYTLIAKEILSKDYWISELHLWGTQMIELTSQGDKFGINTPQKATAARINIHLYNQLHYDSPIEKIDTDEDWTD